MKLRPIGLNITSGVLLLLISQAAVPALAQERTAPQAAAEPIQRTWSLLAQGDTERRMLVDVRLFERIYPTDFAVNLTEEKPASLGDDEDFLKRFFVTNSTGKTDEILALWPDAERVSIGKMLQDESISGPSRRYYALTKQLRFVRKVFYGSYRILLVDVTREASGGSRQDVYVLRHVGDKIYATNSLQDDPARMFIEYLFRSGVAPSETK